ncbi:glycosyltransferase family 4 protein [Paenirhodobacter populi]|uniref:glycosyltransferase family 4 protein n=1 Tax=Paenirhodobacter populi TaxID=2306993 RepID=UPI0019D4A54E|nr:glycosyltransferase family 1 protein [Sinirhodobacter populi]
MNATREFEWARDTSTQRRAIQQHWTKYKMHISNKFYIDVQGIRNYIRHNNTVSGVQRVIHELIKNCRSQGLQEVYLSYFDTGSKQYVSVPLLSENSISTLSIDQLRSMLWPKEWLDARYGLAKYKGRTAKYRIKYLQASILGRRGLSADDFRRDREKVSFYNPRPVLETSTQNDVLLLMDAYIDTIGVKETFKDLRSRGVRVVQFMHDIIPADHSYLYYEDHARNFTTWLCETVEYTSHYICNSDETSNNLRGFLNTKGREHKVSVVKLAREKVMLAPKNKSSTEDFNLYLGVRGEARSLLAHRYVLCVGTREIRKNNWRLLRAWKMLQRRDVNGLPKLVFAGRRGWLNGDFEKFLEASGNLDGLVEIIDGPSDVELEFLYENCFFTAYVSICEGWGLPIGEAIAYGKCGIYSRTAPMPEVGLDSGVYCDPDSIESIADAAELLIRDDNFRMILEGKAQAIGMRTWGTVSHEIIETLRTETA